MIKDSIGSGKSHDRLTTQEQYEVAAKEMGMRLHRLSRTLDKKTWRLERDSVVSYLKDLTIWHQQLPCGSPEAKDWVATVQDYGNLLEYLKHQTGPGMKVDVKVR
jgi:hypothetical protein